MNNDIMKERESMKSRSTSRSREKRRQRTSFPVWGEYVPGLFRETFTTPYEEYAHRIGHKFTVIHAYTESEFADLRGDDDFEPMYRIRFEDGAEIDAWGEEVCQWLDYSF